MTTQPNPSERPARSPAYAKLIDLDRRLKADLTPEQYALVHEYDETHGDSLYDEHCAAVDRIARGLAEAFPGLGPALEILAYALDGQEGTAEDLIDRLGKRDEGVSRD
jgi:hypothetical protein